MEFEAGLLNNHDTIGAGNLIERSRPIDARSNVREAADLLCFSHLPWNLVFQRPQHLMTRFAKDYRVFYVEEAQRGDVGERPRMEVERLGNRLTRVVPRLPGGIDEAGVTAMTRALVSDFVEAHDIVSPVLWYYTPMALRLQPPAAGPAIVYDCMDELSAFHGAPPELVAAGARAVRDAPTWCSPAAQPLRGQARPAPERARVPEQRRRRPFPASARRNLAEPADQAAIPHPRIGFFGVIDERMDIELLAAAGATRGPTGSS